MLRRNKGRICMTLPPETIKTMLESEVSACKAVLAEGPNKCKTPLRISLERFVERSYLLHRHLINRWQGWRYRGAPFFVEDNTIGRQIAAKEWEAFRREVGNMVRDARIPAYTSSVCCQLSTDYGYTLDASYLLSQKTLAERYLLGTEWHGQNFVELKPRTDYVIPIGITRASGSRMDTQINCTIRVGQRIPACIMDALAGKVPGVLLAAWEKLFQRLGELAWGSQKTPLQTTLSCAPSSFLRLGQYGENSCYRHGGEGEYSKFWLAGDCPDSFVALFHRLIDADSAVEAKESVVAGRAWGVACVGRGALVSNFYQLPREMVLPALRDAVSGGLNTQNVESVLQPADASGYSEPWYTLFMRPCAAYLNKDVHLLLNSKSPTRQRMLEHYLKAVLTTAGAHGFWTNNGKGPVLFRETHTIFRLVEPPRTQVRFARMLWPYKDFILKEVTSKAITEEGLFLPSIDGL